MHCWKHLPTFLHFHPRFWTTNYLFDLVIDLVTSSTWFSKSLLEWFELPGRRRFSPQLLLRRQFVLPIQAASTTGRPWIPFRKESPSTWARLSSKALPRWDGLSLGTVSSLAGWFALGRWHSWKGKLMNSCFLDWYGRGWVSPEQKIPHDGSPHETGPLVCASYESDAKQSQRVWEGKQLVLLPPTLDNQANVEAEHERHRDRTHLYSAVGFECLEMTSATVWKVPSN